VTIQAVTEDTGVGAPPVLEALGARFEGDERTTEEGVVSLASPLP